MPSHDFDALSPQDFEELTRDLLQAEWGVSLEAFKTGRDQGIDIRLIRAGAGTVVIQCKHYAGSTVGKLLSHLRDQELPKVQTLNPQRYVIVTSLGLSPANKDLIVAAMSPFVVAASDVLGRDDLNGLLARHPEVERRNFKLWLTNTEVIARILHNAEVCQAEFEVNRIRRKLPLIVQSSAYPRARQILDSQRVLIVSGVPGIGKTTLAEMLLFAHLDDGYEPVVIQSDVAEGKRLFRPDRKQIFYYDDFLGQTFLGDRRWYVGRNQDAVLLSFLEMVRGTDHSRLILTTREHILSQAMQASERLQHSATQTYKCVLELGDYTIAQRARILYNHLYFSDLSWAYKEAVLMDDFFLQIIKHKHFNPRLIEWLTTLTRLSSPPPQRYCESISELLESPERIWSHAFETQISDAAKNLLLVVYSMGEWVDAMDHAEAFEALHRASALRYNRPWSADDFRSALRELDGSFLNYSSGRANFLNPSIRDFTAGVISLDHSVALALIENAVRFKQLQNIWNLALANRHKSLLLSLKANASTMLIHAKRLMQAETMRWEQINDRRVGRPIDIGEELRLEQLVEWAESLEDEEFATLVDDFSDWLMGRWNERNVSFRFATDVLVTMAKADWFMAHGGRSTCRKVLDGLMLHIDEASAADWTSLLGLPKDLLDWTEGDEACIDAGLVRYQDKGLTQEWADCSDVSDLADLNIHLKELEENYGLGLAAVIKSIETEIEERERERPEPDGGGGFSSRNNPVANERISDTEVRDMFSTLRN